MTKDAGTLQNNKVDIFILVTYFAKDTPKAVKAIINSNTVRIADGIRKCKYFGSLSFDL